MERQKEMEQRGAGFQEQESGRRWRRSVWGQREHAAEEALAELGRPLVGWRNHDTGELENSRLLAELQEPQTEEQNATDHEKTQEEQVEEEEGDEEEEEEEDSDEDDDDDDDSDEEEEEEEEEEQEGEEEEATPLPSNQTETHSSITDPLSDCRTADREIHCRGVGVTHLPVFQNLEVTKLDLADNNIRIITPQTFSGLPVLHTLDLSHNKLDDESFSQSPLVKLMLLKKLNLDDNHITRVPALPSSLEELKIGSNRLSALTHHSFKGLLNLLKLDLENNTLREGSVSPLAFRPLRKLLDLQLDSNHFCSLPQGLPRSLQMLKMNKNQINEVTEEPLRGCVRLRVLDLSHNRIHEQGIATGVWTFLKSLEDLNLSHNRLSSIPTNLPRGLLKLTLQHNAINHIPAFVFRHMRPGLRSLHLSHNSLSTRDVEQVAFVGSYRSLKELHLDNNRLQEIPRCVRQFKNLQVLRLDSNQIRHVRQWGVCHPRNLASMLASVHLENNLLKVEAVPPKAFSCVTDAHGLVLHPQQDTPT
ncbi:extracellular matrix protein 2-like [Nothobranchius furzeri]|uniref:Extracellular matrix protein 2-like n=1 Tax=Nothobranchius furzeri TaxID=105023 RepID=A0A9D2XZS3_NOTFU|nr:extracellular matrix protein 2-like [Nothobranchius furzeri]